MKANTLAEDTECTQDPKEKQNTFFYIWKNHSPMLYV